MDIRYITKQELLLPFWDNCVFEPFIVSATMDLHIHNFTEDTILVNCSSKARSKDLISEVLALSLSTSTTRLHKSHRLVALSLPAGTPDSVNLKKGMDLSDEQAVPLAVFKLKLRSSWKAASLPESSPWRVYSKKVHTPSSVFPQPVNLTALHRSILRQLGSWFSQEERCRPTLRKCQTPYPCHPSSCRVRSLTCASGCYTYQLYTGTHDTYAVPCFYIHSS
jgi:hypothetical protein